MRSKQNNTATGTIGENVVCNYLVNHGWQIVVRNYHKSYFELDIIAKKDETIHFIEVKTVSHETRLDLNRAVETQSWRPEEQVHAKKLHKLGLGAEAWLRETGYQGGWQIDVAAVRLVVGEKYATIKLIENIIIE